MDIDRRRHAWLNDRRRLAEERYDTHLAAIYDVEYGQIKPTHALWTRRFLGKISSQASILDAACGTGKYWPLILERGFSIFGIDQSAEMIRRARVKYPQSRAEKTGLQELAFVEEFDGAICIDALEHVPPEDWPVVMENLHRALVQGGLLYFTVAKAPWDMLRQAFVIGLTRGYPILEGEAAIEDGYHFYPSPKQVHRWLKDAQFSIHEEADGDGYWHFLAIKR